MIGIIIFFSLFGAMGLYVALRGERNTELWLVVPPVMLALAFGIWRVFSDDMALGLILSGTLMIFASAAAGALIGLGLGRAVQRQARKARADMAASQVAPRALA